MIAFFCGTPFQLMNAINIRINLENNQQADIYIYDYFRNSKKIYENIIKTNLFRNVYFIEASKCRTPYKLFKEHFIKKSFKRQFSNKKYDILYICYNGILQNILYNIFLSNNQSMKVNFYDEGVATYVYDYKEALKFPRNIILKLLGMKRMDKNLKNIYLYCPEAIQENKIHNVEQLPKISKRDIYIVNIYNDIFEYKPIKNEFKDYEIIFFEESFSSDTNCSDEYLIDLFLKNTDKVKTIVKKHPRVDRNIYEDRGIRCNKDISIPWELYLLNYDFTNKKMVTISSTAVLSAKIIFDEEPEVTLLYKLLKEKAYIHTKSFDKYIETIGNLYKDKEKFRVINVKE